MASVAELCARALPGSWRNVCPLGCTLLLRAPGSGDEGSCSPEPGSPLLPTCGVGRCRCGGLADLWGAYDSTTVCITGCASHLSFF